MTIDNLKQANQALLPYIALVSQLKGGDVIMGRVKPLMALLGDPQDHLRVIHIAGTSGKTSTAYYIDALLRAGGQTVGLTVSPHIDSITERVQIDGKPMAEADFCDELGIFLEIVKCAERPPTYFELLYAFAIWEFVRRGVDYAVVETGMGGLYDATNVIDRPDKICVITDIGFDHTHLLGKTLPEIAAQKAGIIHDYNHVFMYRQTPEIRRVVDEWSRQQHASVHIIDEAGKAFRTDMAAYQLRNWSLAYAVYHYLEQIDSLQPLSRQLLSQTQMIQIPARIDIRQVAGKTIVMDGAHNAQKMATFVTSFQQLYPGVRPAVLVGFKDGKDCQDIVAELAPLAGRVITTLFNSSDDLPAQSIDPDLLAACFRKAGHFDVTSISDQSAAVSALLNASEPICVITGSFYLLAQVRQDVRLQSAVQ